VASTLVHVGSTGNMLSAEVLRCYLPRV